MPLSLIPRAVADAAARLPSVCAVCRGWGSGRVCATCVRRFSDTLPRCRRCAIDVPEGTSVCGNCLVRPPAFARSVTALTYAHPWDGLIARFKFRGGLDLAPTLARLMLANRAPAELRPTLLLPMPLSRARLGERGYNQAWELARRLARSLGCASDARLLVRVKDTPHQLALPPERRADNVRAAFGIEPKRANSLPGRSVTLVDDVMTTGATASEAARTLLAAGASEVSVWVLARTPRPGDR